MNGDGLSDLVVVGRGTNTSNPLKIYIGWNNGQTFNLQTYTPSSALGVSDFFNTFGDFNGDGTVDYYYNNGSSGFMHTFYRGRNQYFVASVRNGLGVNMGFTYKPLSDASVYTRGNNATYPVMTFQGALYVAATAWSDNIDNTASTTSYTYQYGSHSPKGKRLFGVSIRYSFQP